MTYHPVELTHFRSVHGAGDLQEEYDRLLNHYMRANTRSAGHGKPVDVWAMGVITYFLLAGRSHGFVSVAAT